MFVQGLATIINKEDEVLKQLKRYFQSTKYKK